MAAAPAASRPARRVVPVPREGRARPAPGTQVAGPPVTGPPTAGRPAQGHLGALPIGPSPMGRGASRPVTAAVPNEDRGARPGTAPAHQTPAEVNGVRRHAATGRRIDAHRRADTTARRSPPPATAAAHGIRASDRRIRAERQGDLAAARRARTSKAGVREPARRTGAALRWIVRPGDRSRIPAARRGGHGRAPGSKGIRGRGPLRPFRRRTCSGPMRNSSRVVARSRRSSRRAAPPIGCSWSRSGAMPSNNSSSTPRGCGSRSWKSKVGR